MATSERLPPAADQADKAQVESTRARLLTAAYDLLVKDGYHATTVQGIARKAGLTTGAIYANFANKQELMACAVLERWSVIEQQFVGLAMRAAEPDEVLLRYLGQHIAAEATPEHQLLTEVTGAVLRDVGDVSPLRAGVEAIEAMARSNVEKSQADGTIDPSLDVDALVAVIVSVYLGAITTKSWGLTQPKLEATMEVLAAIQRGIAPQ